jgi:hypothetical protein
VYTLRSSTSSAPKGVTMCGGPARVRACVRGLCPGRLGRRAGCVDDWRRPELPAFFDSRSRGSVLAHLYTLATATPANQNQSLRSNTLRSQLPATCFGLTHTRKGQNRSQAAEIVECLSEEFGSDLAVASVHRCARTPRQSRTRVYLCGRRSPKFRSSKW